MDVETAQGLLGEAAAGFEIASVAPLDGGAVHSLYEVTEREGRSLVLKLYRGEMTWKLDKELYLYELVRRQTEVPIPEIVHVGGAFVFMTRVPGMPFRFLDLSESALADVNRQLGRLLRELHAITFDAFGYIETGVTSPASSNLEYMRRRIEGKLRGFDQRGGDSELRQAIERHFTAHEQAFAGCETPVLCHNDAHDANVLVDDGRITGVIDWENAVAGDPILDLAKSWAFSDGRSDETFEALSEGYGPLRPDWREAFDLYVVDHLLELWVWLAQVGVTDPLPEIEGYLARRVGLPGS